MSTQPVENAEPCGTASGDRRETMTVAVRDRGSESPWGSGLTDPVVRTVTISAYCRTCGGRRGEPRGLNQFDDGVFYWVEVWENPCGHADAYADVVVEARELEEAHALEMRRLDSAEPDAD